MSHLTSRRHLKPARIGLLTLVLFCGAVIGESLQLENDRPKQVQGEKCTHSDAKLCVALDVDAATTGNGEAKSLSSVGISVAMVQRIAQRRISSEVSEVSSNRQDHLDGSLRPYGQTNATAVALKDCGMANKTSGTSVLKPPTSASGGVTVLQAVSYLPYAKIYNGYGSRDVAIWIVSVTGVLVLLFIVLSLAWVASVPPKLDDCSQAHDNINIADEKAGWKAGFVYWLNMGWADNLMGRYGKCLSAVAACDKELVRDRADSDYEPHRMFRRAWDEQIQRTGGMENASMSRALLNVIGLRGCCLLLFGAAVEVGVSMVGMVVALDSLLGYLQDSSMEKRASGNQIDLLHPSLMIIVLAIVAPLMHRAASVVVTLVDGHYTNLCAAGLSSVVYEKALLLPATATGCGNMVDAASRPNGVQLLNVDIIELWRYLLKTLAHTLVTPIFVVILVAMLIVKLRLAGLLGTLYIIPVLCVTWCVQLFNARSWNRYQKHQENRLKCFSDLILNIRTIKEFSLERFFHDRIHAAREKELEASFACAFTSGCSQANLHSIPWFAMALTLGILCMLDGPFEAREVFVVQRIMMSLCSMLHAMSVGSQKLASVPKSLSRIKAFLRQQERPRNVVREPALEPDAPAVRLIGSFAFEPADDPVLRNLDLAIPRGEFVAVIGNTGSGKSALLLSIIGELFPTGHQPMLEAPSGVAFCAQVPWIFEGTLRENITLNQQHDPDRYSQILHDTGLVQDINALPGHDLAEIGSFGIRLSANQRARVALARAAYMEHSDLVLLDDPLASMDPKTGRFIFNELLLGPLLKGRTRIMALDPDADLLAKFDRVILLEEGRVALVGPPSEVVAADSFCRLVDSLGHIQSAADSVDGCSPHALIAEIPQSPESLKVRSPQGASELVSPLPRWDNEAHDRFTWDTLQMWFRSAGICNLIFCLFLIALLRLAFLCETLVLARWVDNKVGAEKDVDDRYYICVLVGSVTLACVIFVLLYWAAGKLSISASREIHNRVLSVILRVPTERLFDKQPIGRLVTRVSDDLRYVDNAVAVCVLMMTAFFLGFLTSQFYILSNVHWTVALCAMPLYGTMSYFIYLYRGTTAPLVFHSKFARSCIQDLQGVVLNSCVSIRANGMRADFMARHNHYSATITRSQYLVFHVAKAWVQTRVTLCFSALTMLFCIGGLWDRMPMGTLATIISLSFMAVSEFEIVSQVYANFVSIMNSVQRLAQMLSNSSGEALHQEISPRSGLNADGSEKDQLSKLESELDLQPGMLLQHSTGRTREVADS